MSADFLKEALDLAKQGIGRVSPNPAVGAVIVKDGQVAGRGFHTFDGVKHAEALALEQAGEDARGATVYVTLEPCAHDGRTPSCAEALVAAGVAKVVAIGEDPNPRVKGKGFEKLRAAGVEVVIDETHAAEAHELNMGFFHFMRTGLPLVTLKSAVTLDGKISAPDDNTGWITSERARAHVQQVRHAHDAILTGIGTVLEDDPMLTDRSGIERSRPFLRIVADSQLRLPLESRLVRSCRKDLMVVCSSVASPARRELLERRDIEVVVADGPQGRIDLVKLVQLLGERQYLSLMIEAGSQLNWSALESGIVDRIFFYYAPKILGGMQSLPVAGGLGRRRRMDAIEFTNVKLHQITENEFAVEAWVPKG